MTKAILGTLVSLAFCLPAWAQDDSDYDPEYDDDTAAGSMEYSDVEAVGDGSMDTGGSIDVDLASDFENYEDEDEDEDAADADEEESPRDELDPWEWGAHRHHSGLHGTTGLLHIVEAGSDDAGTFGLQFHGAFFKYTSYLYPDDEHSHMWGTLNLRVTPLDFLEIYGGFESRANYNDSIYPELFQTLGDFTLGFKGFYSPVDWFTFGGLFGMTFMNPVGEVGVTFEGTSFDLGLMTTFDFTEINPKAPIRAHLNFGWYFDRSANLIADVEKIRGGCDQDVDGDGQPDYEGCLNPVERTGLGVNRNDQFRIGIGLDALLPYVSPIAEYFIEIPVNRQDFTCPESIPGSPDSCMQAEGGRGMHQWITLGARVLPPLDSLAIDIGVDIGLTGYAPTVHELSAQAPYRVMFGLTYNFDPFRDDEEQLPPPPPPPLPPPPEPPDLFIAGFVHDSENPEVAVPGAVITYVGHSVNPQVSNGDGRFRSYSMFQGAVTITVTAEGYEDGTFTVELPDPSTYVDNPFLNVRTPAADLDVDGGVDADEADGADGGAPPPEMDVYSGGFQQVPAEDVEPPEFVEIELDCPLKALPKKGSLVLKVVDPEGVPVAGASVTLAGPVEESGAVGADGLFEITLDPGTFTLGVEKDGFLRKSRSVEIMLETRSEIEVQLTPKPKSSNVLIKKKRIVIRKKIHFATNSDEILANSFPLMDEISDLFLSHPEITVVEIQGHTDNKGRHKYNMELSERRAKAVRQYLVDSGIPPERLEAKGYGPNKPKAPNFTAQGRRRNRRVEFHILEQKSP